MPSRGRHVPVHREIQGPGRHDDVLGPELVRDVHGGTDLRRPCAARVPAAESCNLVDDDCNGLTDDAIPATDCDLTNQWGTCKGKGLCAGGQILCQGSYASPEDCLTAADDNCNGTANEKDAPHCTSFFRDVDGDGWGTVESQCWCAPSGEWRAIKPGDCDDGNAAVHPGTTEDCATAFDDDCDGSLDAVDALHCTAWHWDADNDGWGTGATQCRCAASGSWRATKGGDCDDTNAAVFPGGGAVCGKDGGCDGNVLDSGEQCDDGNAVARDGCTACKVSEYRLFPDVVGTVEGTPQAAGKQESCVGNRPHVDAAAFADGSYVVTWTGTTATDTQTAVYLRRVSAAGVAGPLVTVTTPEFGSFNCHGEPSIVGFPDGRFVVVWTSGNDNDSAYTAPAYPPGPDGWGMGIAARLFLADGTPAGAPFVANPWTTGHQFHARAAAIPGGFVLVWTGQGATRAAGIWARRFDSAGAPLGDAMAVNTVAENASPLVAAWADGRFVVYWNVLYGESFPFLRKFRADATPDGSEIVANGNYGNPNFNVTPTSLAAVAGGALVADFDLSSKDIFENWATSVRTVFAADGTAGTPTLVVPTGNSSLNGLSGSLAPLPAGGFAAYWVIDCNHGSRCSTDLAYACVDSLNCTEVVPGGLFTAAGVATGTTFGVGGHGGPIAVFPDGSFLVAWAELVSSSGPSLFVQRYGADGTRVYR